MLCVIIALIAISITTLPHTALNALKERIRRLQIVHKYVCGRNFCVSYTHNTHREASHTHTHARTPLHTSVCLPTWADYALCAAVPM